MPYDSSKDPTKSTSPGLDSLGKTGRTGIASDTVDLSPYARSIVLLTSGTLKIIPLGNDDAAPIAWTEALSAGWVCPFAVRRVFATGTTATFATID